MPPRYSVKYAISGHNALNYLHGAAGRNLAASSRSGKSLWSFPLFNDQSWKIWPVDPTIKANRSSDPHNYREEIKS